MSLPISVKARGSREALPSPTRVALSSLGGRVGIERILSVHPIPFLDVIVRSWVEKARFRCSVRQLRFVVGRGLLRKIRQGEGAQPAMDNPNLGPTIDYDWSLLIVMPLVSWRIYYMI
ncbi:hypothetical protein ACLOJK_022180 [Asimina triloba]